MNAINRHLQTNFTAIIGTPRDADAEWEAENGICAGDYYANVCEEDREPSPRVSLADDVPDYFAGTPFPINQTDEE
jgi:hypothetical protein